MPRRTYAFAHDDGRISKRTSEKEYTHAVVGCMDLRGRRKNAEEGRALHRQAWQNSKRIAEVGPGKEWREPSRGKQYIATPHEVGAALRLVAEYPTADAYADACIAQHYGEIGEGDEGEEEVLQWSQTERAARAALGRYLARYRNVRVVEVRAI